MFVVRIGTSRSCNKPTYAVQQKPLMMFQCHLCGMGWIGRHRFLGNFHNSWQPDREGGPAARFAVNRDVAAHHLAEAPAEGAAEARAAVFARRIGGSLGNLLE